MLEISSELQDKIVSEVDTDIKIEAVSSLDNLKSHEGAWNEMARHSPHRLPMVSYDWVSSRFETQLEEDEGWFVLFAYKKESLIGVLPVELKLKKSLGISRHIMITPASAASVLPDTGSEAEVITLFLKYIKSLKYSSRGLHLRQLPGSSPWVDHTSSGPRNTIFVEELHGYGSYIKVAGSYDDYLDSLSTRFKRNIRRLRRKVEKLGEVKFDIIQGKDIKPQLLQDFIEIEASGWKKRQGTSMKQQPELVNFYNKLSERLARHNTMRWYILHSDDKTLAMQLDIKVGRSLIITKIAYDENYYNYSPGTLLFDRMVEDAFKSGEIDEINCLTDHPWNRNWNMDRRPLYNISVYPRKLESLFSIIPQRAKLRLITWGRSIPGLTNLYHRIMGHKNSNNG